MTTASWALTVAVISAGISIGNLLWNMRAFALSGPRLRAYGNVLITNQIRINVSNDGRSEAQVVQLIVKVGNMSKLIDPTNNPLSARDIATGPTLPVVVPGKHMISWDLNIDLNWLRKITNPAHADLQCWVVLGTGVAIDAIMVIPAGDRLREITSTRTATRARAQFPRDLAGKPSRHKRVLARFRKRNPWITPTVEYGPQKKDEAQ